MEARTHAQCSELYHSMLYMDYERPGTFVGESRAHLTGKWQICPPKRPLSEVLGRKPIAIILEEAEKSRVEKSRVSLSGFDRHDILCICALSSLPRKTLNNNQLYRNAHCWPHT